ncbi:hypothetical protein GE061_000152 [Apolygus lucorum]|uniref:Uncharacterized protein n=1 Tax=Apolygus lucorum TaxID=248454 RepID=A0A6A4KNW7_APOLU|nr:hypothetical protein GE061_000152 [Apolygus lucorum]
MWSLQVRATHLLHAFLVKGVLTRRRRDSSGDGDVIATGQLPFQMMVAEFIERQNTSPMNGEAGLHSSGPVNGANNNPVSSLHSGLAPNNNNNNNGGGPNGCNVSYCMIEPEYGMMSRESNDSNSEHDSQYPSNYDMNHMQRKDLFSQRKQREFIPDNKKDESYWDRRRRNNEAAKRSREKRRYNDMILEQRVVELSKENHFLKAQLTAIKDKYGISGEAVVNVEQVMATLPTNDQVLSITKRAKISNSAPPMSIYQGSPVSVPIPTPVIHRTVGPSPPLAPLHPAAVYPVESDSYPQEPSDRYPFPFTPVLPPLNPPVLEAAGNSVLNLSRSRSSPSPYELPLPLDPPAASCLPHKLRHKSHLGDKDVAATALLSLHNIKQEPGARASPPWDGEGSSDERDSGISLGAEWIMTPHNSLATEPHHSPSHHGHSPPHHGHSPSHDCIEPEDDEATHIKSEVARLASEVASLKSLLSRKKAAAN